MTQRARDAILAMAFQMVATQDHEPARERPAAMLEHPCICFVSSVWTFIGMYPRPAVWLRPELN